jgi:crossover junction endodeoxyribonuclease RuvC
MVHRLRQIMTELRALITQEQPQVAAIEEVYFSKNSQSAASVGHARGVLLYGLSEMGLPVHEYNPRQVKMALTGHGGADKPQMQKMLQLLLSLKEVPRPDDAADALAIALCHLHTETLQSLIAP